MALGTNQLCMPPFVPALCIEVGYYLRHGEFLTEVSLRTLGREALQRFWEWLLGACVVGPLLAVAVGGSVWVVAAYLQRSGVVEPCASNPLDPPLAKGEGTVRASPRVASACGSNPLDPPLTKGAPRSFASAIRMSASGRAARPEMRRRPRPGSHERPGPPPRRPPPLTGAIPDGGGVACATPPCAFRSGDGSAGCGRQR